MKQNLKLECERIDDVDAWNRDDLKITLLNVDMNCLVSDYKSDLLGLFDIEDLIKAVEEEGYRVEED
jgi:hypothetical protein